MRGKIDFNNWQTEGKPENNAKGSYYDTILGNLDTIINGDSKDIANPFKELKRARSKVKKEIITENPFQRIDISVKEDKGKSEEKILDQEEYISSASEIANKLFGEGVIEINTTGNELEEGVQIDDLQPDNVKLDSEDSTLDEDKEMITLEDIDDNNFTVDSQTFIIDKNEINLLDEDTSLLDKNRNLPTDEEYEINLINNNKSSILEESESAEEIALTSEESSERNDSDKHVSLSKQEFDTILGEAILEVINNNKETTTLDLLVYNNLDTEIINLIDNLLYDDVGKLDNINRLIQIYLKDKPNIDNGLLDKYGNLYKELRPINHKSRRSEDNVKINKYIKSIRLKKSLGV